MANPNQQPVSATAHAPADEAKRLDQGWLFDEQTLVSQLLQAWTPDQTARAQIREQAIELVAAVRKRPRARGVMEAFMREYDLSSEEGVVLMCLAEALLRVPDADTAERLIADKLSVADWSAHSGRSDSLFVNASTWGLMLTGRLVRASQSQRRDLSSTLARMVNRSGEPAIRLAMAQAMKIMGQQYVMGRTIAEAIKRARSDSQKTGERYSFDMLGEAALTRADAERYAQAYRDAIAALGGHRHSGSVFEADSISVKLSALHPRYERAQFEQVMRDLVPVLLGLAQQAMQQGIALTVDAEEADRLSLSLQVFAAVRRDASLAGWNGLGLAVQAYHKRSLPVVQWLLELAASTATKLPVRLVKGAYWDSEIKWAQINGLAGYPVFTRKPSTDLSYLVCAQALLAAGQAIYPQFATHNAHTIAAISHLARKQGATEFEFQRLHGMGQALYDTAREMPSLAAPCRVYAPVGAHEDLLPYLVRRLLENGANTSFVNRIVDEALTPDQVVTDPVDELSMISAYAHPRIPLPHQLFGPSRANSAGLNLNSVEVMQDLQAQFSALEQKPSRLFPSAPTVSAARDVRCPFDKHRVLGRWDAASEAEMEAALQRAADAQPEWSQLDGSTRVNLLRAFADELESECAVWMWRCVQEAGKSLPDALAEVREAIDFCRYYASQAEQELATALQLPGPTGETNVLRLEGRGVVLCISPWNFPLAIFVGQVAAALVTGNTGIAKPAPQTSLIALEAVAALHRLGVPKEVLHCLPGDGDVGAHLCADERVAGVAFTGSTATARRINQTLAQRDGPLPMLIAETGGQNAMIVDSSALAEQVVRDVISSGFLSAGQRCSALRVLCVQTDIADHVLRMLAGAMQTLVVGCPEHHATDVGPVIDERQLAMLQAHDLTLQQSPSAKLIARSPLPAALPDGHWFAPVAYELSGLEQLGEEVFGPIVHVVRFHAKELDKLVDQINQLGYGLTLGVHSRIEQVQQRIAKRARVGNVYVNRNMTGAVVGVQPFGGRGLSGTGPKAGGPHYLHRFVTEKTITVNTAAVGGNASLLALSE